jgi:general secretion pathway protein M
MMKFLHRKPALTRREKLSILAGTSAVVIFIVVQFCVVPLLNGKAKMRRSIQTNERMLKEIIELRTDYCSFKDSADTVGAALMQRNKNFTLFSFLERQAGRAGVKANIAYMKPSTATEAGPFKESIVEMKLEDITLKQIIDYLYFIESPKDLVRIKRISIKQSKNNRQSLTVLIHVVTYC